MFPIVKSFFAQIRVTDLAKQFTAKTIYFICRLGINQPPPFIDFFIKYDSLKMYFEKVMFIIVMRIFILNFIILIGPRITISSIVAELISDGHLAISS